MSPMIQFEDAWLRVDDIVHIRNERGHSYHKLIVTMRDGEVFTHRDWQGSAYELERELLAAINRPADGGLDWEIPCDVKLPPQTTIVAGCSVRTLLDALRLEGRPTNFGGGGK